jgi:hypothetical protein
VSSVGGQIGHGEEEIGNAEIDAPELEGQVLLALIDGVAVAALSLHDGRVAANPFLPTRDVVAVLRLRAGHVVAEQSGRRPRRLPRLRLA